MRDNVQPLNYSRQLAKQCMDRLAVPSTSPKWRAVYSSVVDLHKASTKFMLPDEGQLMDDPELRAIDENEPIRLPYPFVALEYFTREPNMGGEDAGWEFDGTPVDTSQSTVSAPKRVIFARARDEWIAITPAHWSKHDGVWNVQPEVLLPVTGYLDRSRTSKYGRPGVLVSAPDGAPIADYMDEITVLLGFLNALACSNVGTSCVHPKKAGKVKTALPFDSYHVLVIRSNDESQRTGTGTHRSPREHLRRGHIRRLQDGRRIWINATVVGAGRGAGVVTKDYALPRAA